MAGIYRINYSDPDSIGRCTGVKGRVMCFPAVTYSCYYDKTVLFCQRFNASGPPVFEMTADADSYYIAVRWCVGVYIIN